MMPVDLSGMPNGEANVFDMLLRPDDKAHDTQGPHVHVAYG